MGADTLRMFPEVEGRNLEDREFRLPQDFEGAANLVLLAFRREHQELVDTWMPAAGALADTLAGFRYYELPVLASGYTLFRSFIDGGMRSGIPDLAARERTITLYINKRPLREALGFTSEDTIYALVLSSDGRVVHMDEGAYTTAKGAAVEAAVRSLLEMGGGPGASAERGSE